RQFDWNNHQFLPIYDSRNVVCRLVSRGRRESFARIRVSVVSLDEQDDGDNHRYGNSYQDQCDGGQYQQFEWTRHSHV
ncbi:MAG: hypothetical protein KDA71_14335, partial [Planctomycetales bacterium]|nr:hypothetical protein [Planctomycetales bacterium]